MTRRGAATRDSLLQAATELVAEVGYHQATTRLIAERAGVAEGSIYRHFPDKRALFTAAILDRQQGVTQWMSQLPSRAGSAPVLDILTETFTQLSKLRESIIPLEIALAAEPELHRTVTAANLTEAVQDLGGPPHLLARYLQAEQDLDRIDPGLDPTRTAVVLLASLFGVQTSPLAQPGGLDAKAIRELVQIFLTGISPPAGGRSDSRG